MQQVAPATAGSGASVVPVGSVIPYAGAASSSTPFGWLHCDGSAVSKTTYAALFTVLGTAYGAGNGSTTFNVPDLRSRIPVGAGTFATRGDTEGATEPNRTLRHSHGSGSIATSGDAATTSRNSAGSGTAFNAPNAGHSHSITGTTGLNAKTGADGIPYLGINYLVKF